MGARKGISGGKCSPWCAIKEKLDTLWNKTQNAYTHVNGYDADGSQNLQINGSEGITVETVSGNEIKLIGVAAEPYVAESPIVIDADTKTVSLLMDSAPVSGSENAVTSGGVYAADQTLQTNIDTEASARSAVDTALGGRIDTVQNNLQTEASARAAADTALGGRIDNVINGTTPVQKATQADTATQLSGILPVANGGTGHTDGTAVLRPEGPILGGVLLPDWAYTHISIGGSSNYVAFSLVQGSDRNNMTGIQTIHTASNSYLRLIRTANGVYTEYTVQTM